MIDAHSAPYAVLLLRVALGVLFLAHCWLKLVVFKPAGTVAWFESIGQPGGLAYVAIALELGGGLALILGIWPRVVALALVPLILGTIYAVHGRKGWLFSNEGGGWEYPAFWAAALVVLFALGDGACALVPSPLSF
jgi:putative oxidoreductase